MSSKLFAGPWLGEFGWELMMWQGHIRTLSKEYDEIVVSSRTGHEYLYKDFYTEYIPHDVNGQTDCELCNGVIDNQTPKQWKSKGYDIFKPKRFPRLKGDPDHKVFKSQTFVKYGTIVPNLSYDIVIHARNTNKCRTGYRNWSKGKWLSFIERFNDMSICTIGSCDASLDLGVDDYRGCSLETTANILASSRCIVGPSSGPMHLASLCGCTHIVLTDDTNRLRYETEWNPFNTTAIVLDQEGWDPSVDFVVANVNGVLNG